jgi:membrane associated rhomboid family serine protease
MSFPPPVLPRCYRHPDRETGRSCTRCGKPSCSACLVQATIGSHCTDCVRESRPSAAVRARDWNAGQHLLVTKLLIAANIAVFIWVVAGETRALSTAGLVSPRQYDIGLARFFLEQGEWYRMVTSGFLHYGLIHLGMNMYLLYVLGNMLEPAIGRTRFTLLYFAALLGGSAGAMILQPAGLHGGASGAVFGLMGAAAVGLTHRGVNPFSTGIGTVLLLNLVITFTIPGISVGGHLGGAAAGALCATVMLAPRHRGAPQWSTYVTPVAVAALAVGLTVAVV